MPEAEVVDSESTHSGNLPRPVTPSAGDLHHITVSLIFCVDQCCYMYPGLRSSAIGPVAQWQEPQLDPSGFLSLSKA